MRHFELLINSPSALKISSSLPELLFSSEFVSLYRERDEKLTSDDCFVDDKDFLIFLQGIVFNRTALQSAHNSFSWQETLKILYKKNPLIFFKDLRGSFCGFVWDKRHDVWRFFTDHVGYRPLFISDCGQGCFYISSDPLRVFTFRKKNALSISLNRRAAYALLSYGYLLDDDTLSNEILKLMAGCYWELKNNRCQSYEYHRLRGVADHKSCEEDLIQEVNERFRNAVKAEFEKDEEYGIHRHAVTLSAGMDSRMVVFVAQELGFSEQLNLTYSQTGKLDEIIPQEIAAALKHEWLFKSLDIGSALIDVDEITRKLCGNMLYPVAADSFSLLRYINFDQFGLLHTGMIGDVIFGTGGNSLHVQPIGFEPCPESTMLLNRLRDYHPKREYENRELFRLYQREFPALAGVRAGQENFVETVTPFADVETMEAGLKVPVELRYNHRFYLKLMRKYYPYAASFNCGRFRTSPAKYKEPHIVHLCGRSMPVSEVLPRFIRKLNPFAKAWVNGSMRPYELWLSPGTHLREFYDNYVKNHMSLIDDTELRTDVQRLYSSQKPREMSMVIGFLAANKLLL